MRAAIGFGVVVFRGLAATEGLGPAPDRGCVERCLNELTASHSKPAAVPVAGVGRGPINCI